MEKRQGPARAQSCKVLLTPVQFLELVTQGLKTRVVGRRQDRREGEALTGRDMGSQVW